MLLGRCCRCDNHGAVTIKGINLNSGTTSWEYGPGSWWRKQPGASSVWGLVPVLDGTKDKYVLAPQSNQDIFESSPVRSVSAPEANCFEGVTLTQLDSTNGTVTDSSVVEGFFCSNSTSATFALSPWLTIIEAVTMSAAGYVIVGIRRPSIEFVDFTANLAAKTYILHAHNQQAGTVTLRTRTSSETIVLDYDATAAEVKTAFEATSDCTAATCTGGPWPHRSIQVDATWSVSTGDISGIKTSDTYVDDTTTRTVNGAATCYSVATGLIESSVGYIFGRTGDTTPSKLLNITGTVPTYSTKAVCKFVHAKAGASFDTLVIKPSLESGPSGCADTVECWTVASTWSRDWQRWTNIGASGTGSDNYELTSVQNNMVCVSFPNRTFSAGDRCAAIVSISGGTVNAEVDRTDAISLSTLNNQNSAATFFSEADSTTTNVSENELTITDSERPNVKFEIHFEGEELFVDTDTFLLGTNSNQGINRINAGRVYGIDSTYIFGPAITGDTQVRYGLPLRNPAVQAAGDKQYYWTFYRNPHRILDTGTEFRFRFAGATVKTTAWMDWHETAANIHTALINCLGENTGGVFSNAEVYPFGEPSGPTNSTVSTLEKGLDIIFHASGNATGVALGYINPSYVSNGRITIELQNVTQFNANGISAWRRDNGAVEWQRTFGTSVVSGLTTDWPDYGWIDGNLLIVAGQLVDPE